MWQPMRPLLDGFITLTMGDASIPLNKTLKNCWLALLNQPVAPTIDSTTTLLVGAEANFPGYSRIRPAITVGPFTGEGGWSLGSGSTTLWQPLSSDSPNSIYGQALISSDSTTLLAVELFDAPIPLPTAGNGFLDTPVIGLGPNAAGYGSSIITS